jgi:hypothetical protein
LPVVVGGSMLRGAEARRKEVEMVRRHDPRMLCYHCLENTHAGARQCHGPRRCLHCGDGEHRVADCPTRERKARCHVCGGPHRTGDWDCPTSYWPPAGRDERSGMEEAEPRTGAVEETEDTTKRLAEARRQARAQFSTPEKEMASYSVRQLSFSSVRSSEAELTTPERQRREAEGILPPIGMVRVSDKSLSDSMEWKQDWEKSGDLAFAAARDGERMLSLAPPREAEREGSADSVRSTASTKARRKRQEAEATEAPAWRDIDVMESGEKKARTQSPLPANATSPMQAPQTEAGSSGPRA